MFDFRVVTHARAFLEEHVHPWWQSITCRWGPELRTHAVELLLAGIYLQLDRLNTVLSRGGRYFRITPFSLVANGPPVQVLDIEVQGAVRDIAICLDSAVGLPDPVIRLSTDASGTAGDGVRMEPGRINELGKVPPNTRLFISSDVNINGYVIERG
jgi:hypothetical protein